MNAFWLELHLHLKTFKLISLSEIQKTLYFTIVSLMLFLIQAGQNQGATQAGHGGMGNTRHM